ncbi:unnamed protein product [Gongylonema pulchrum]|uniref:Uncharacterized protein n=1 Tax=Gongylonema pulchrum TaxID=637853 RepID=A0A183E336_9BILA|nr:unnamed protein product [Gongylonema pulchrum]
MDLTMNIQMSTRDRCVSKTSPRVPLRKDTENVIQSWESAFTSAQTKRIAKEEEELSPIKGSSRTPKRRRVVVSSDSEEDSSIVMMETESSGQDGASDDYRDSPRLKNLQSLSVSFESF